MMERISAAHGRLEAEGTQLEREGVSQRTAIGEIRESTSRCQSDIVKITECLALVQVDTQRVDQTFSDLEGSIYKFLVSNWNRAYRIVKRRLPSSNIPWKGRLAQVYQEFNMLVGQIIPWSIVAPS